MRGLAARGWNIVGGILRSKSLLASIGYAAAGGAFTLGNLLLARALPVADFGQFALLIAIFNIASVLGPFGVDQVLLRRLVDPAAGLLFRLLAGSLVMAAVGAGVAAYYRIPTAVVLLLAASIVAASTGVVAASGLRRHGWASLSLAGLSITSWGVLLGGIVSLAVPRPTVVVPSIVLAATALMIAIVSWATLAKHHRVPSADREAVPHGEALWFTLVVASGALVMHGERLLIPYRLGYEALATFSVLASVTIFPFRLMRSGAGFAIVPRLRNSADVRQRRHLLAAELRAMIVMMSLTTIAMLVIVPPVAHLFTDGRYQLTIPLVLAACLSGAAKLADALPRAVITACGTAAEVRSLAWMTWVGVAASLAGVWIGATWGLVGLVCGSAAGSLVGAVPSALLARRAIKHGYIG